MEKVRDGYKMTELGEIPVEWKVVSTEDIVIDSKGSIKIGPFGSQLKKELLVDKGYKVYGQENVFSRNYILGNRYVTNEKFEELKSCELKSGDFVISMMGTVGKCDIVPKNIKTGIMDSHLLRLRVNDNKFNKDLLKQLIGESYIVKKQIKKLSVGGIMDGLSSTIIKQLKYPKPNIEEQQKISLILSSVAEKIEITDNLIGKTKVLKKGLMQRLLTEGIGHDRFRDTEIGRIPEEWEIRSLINISQGKGDYGIGAVATEYVIGKPRYLRITDIGDNSKVLLNNIKGFEDDEYEKYLLKQNDIVFARTGNTTGKSYVYSSKDGELVYAGFLIKFAINPEIANVNFIKYIIQSKRYWDWINVMSTRSGQPGINSNEYAKFIVPLPNVKEQNRIASLLLSVDEKIDQYESKKEKLQELKKGLMQILLTGKIRVK